MAETPRRSRPGELHRRQVVLLAESAGLISVLGHLLGPDDRLSRVGSLRELAGSRSLDAADVVVLDPPDGDRDAAVRQVRRRYRGPLVVLASEGERPGGPLPDDACTLLTRPFSVEGLAAALGVPGRTSAAAAAAVKVPPPAPAAPPNRLEELVDRAQRLLIALVEGWQTRRRVRVAGLAALAAAAFAVAFAVAAKGPCGPGCNPLGTGISPTIASIESRAPSTTGPRHPASTTTIRAGTPGTGAFLGTSGRRGAAGTTTNEWSAATSTTRRPVTTRPATSGPATTPATAPPTTTPPTTSVTTPPTTASETPATGPTPSG